MDKYQAIRSFISAASEYSRHPSETTTSVLQRNLIAINSSTDLSIFDPGSTISSEFYMYLYNLANSHELRSSLIWSILDVLQHACKNAAARQAFIHTYKFSQILSKLLETNLIPDKRMRILKLLQELTHGVRIHWQEAHLPHLMSTLTQWIMQSKEEEIVSLSLGVLINLCYRNLPAVYTLMRTIDPKALHRTLLKLQCNNSNIKVQCCKLLMIMEHTHKDIPDKVILEFIMVTFQSILTALKSKDSSLLRQIVEFFEDMKQNEHSRLALTSYQNYHNDVKNILERLNVSLDPLCVALVLEFILSLIKLKLPSLVSLYSQFIKISMEWISCNNNNDQVIIKALALIKTIVVESRRSKGFGDLISDLNLKALMVVVENENDTNELSDEGSIETNSKLTELIQLLSEMSKVPNLRAQVTEAFNEQTMRRLLRPLCEQKDLTPANNWPGFLLHNPSISFYIYALILAADLSSENSNWLSLYSELIQKKQIQMIIAVTIFTGEYEIKQKCLQLMTSVGFPQECVAAVSKCLCELEPIVLIQSKPETLTNFVNKRNSFLNSDMTPSISVTQQEQLDATISNINELITEKKISDINVTSIMELYNYKLSIMENAEKINHSNLEAADRFATNLQQRLDQMIAESNRLHQLLFHFQYDLQNLQADKMKVSTRLQEVEKETKRLHSDQKQEIQGLKKIVEEKSTSLEKVKKDYTDAINTNEELKKKNEEYESKNSSMENQIQEMTQKINDFNKLITKLQDKLSRREQTIEVKEKEIETYSESIAALKQENEQLMRQCRGYEQEIAEKEENNTKMIEEIKELSRMRDMIYQITAKKKDTQNETT
ncbi:uncharacterized protein [Chelonus insularis]|uniref:uncharacterized protein n=1 Tax=Chelonus insularis TaxID=460826 RepID=UPI001588E062|nr:uncharacterized protein LOC118073007 [Chelonus insularis]XP_034949168.1 uncharacterized protein LOC118073007 [Chelonus insularis]XP_034949169.1 uncharacterized protein LOC118073007 [Chelonus insularis]